MLLPERGRRPRRSSAGDGACGSESSPRSALDVRELAADRRPCGRTYERGGVVGAVIALCAALGWELLGVDLEWAVAGAVLGAAWRLMLSDD